MKNKILDIWDTVLDKLDTVAPFLISLAIIAALILCSEIYKEKANNNAAQKYNGGICAKCSTEYQFDGTSGAFFTLYNYHCPSCGEIINSYAPMIKTDGGTK